jgi:tellurite resistance protein TerC
MNVATWVWALTILALLAVLAADLCLVDRRPHEISVGEAARWVVFYVGLAIAFGLGLGFVAGTQYAKQFFAGYITEYSLSVDNLFVFVVIMTAFAVPRIHQHKVLLFGILGALVLRGLFIAAGAAVIAKFEWVFYLFGAFLIYTAYKLATGGEQDPEYRENGLLRLACRVLPMSKEYHGARIMVKVAGRRVFTPMLVVMLAIGTTDLLFALDSIPAIFGLTREPYLVFTANLFALMGLRQLYFLIGGLLSRLVYLSKGLAVILGFIGVKLVSEALAASGVDRAPHFGIELSLGVIVGVLAVTTAASLIKVRRNPEAVRKPSTSAADRPPVGPAPADRASADRASADRASADRASADRASADRASGDPVQPTRYPQSGHRR